MLTFFISLITFTCSCRGGLVQVQVPELHGVFKVRDNVVICTLDTTTKRDTYFYAQLINTRLDSKGNRFYTARWYNDTDNKRKKERPSSEKAIKGNFNFTFFIYFHLFSVFFILFQLFLNYALGHLTPTNVFMFFHVFSFFFNCF